MARKQAAKGSWQVSSQSSLQPGRPVLRRGPQRTVRDAITTLGDIPILRPQLQQATYLSAGEHVQDNSELQIPGPRGRVDSVSSSISSVQHEQAAPANITSPTSSATRALHLPFQLGRGHRDPLIPPAFIQDHIEGLVASPETPPAPYIEELSGATLLEGNAHARSATSSSPAGLRGGGPPKRDRVPASAQDMSLATSPLQQVQRTSLHGQALPPSDSSSRSTANEESPTIYLKGYVADPSKYSRGPAYWFREVLPHAPQTEPRRGNGRQAMPKRSLSSSSVPNYPVPAERPALLNSSSDDIFGPVIAPEHPPHFDSLTSGNNSQQQLPPTAGSRQFSSEASATSGAFSFYELPPESRQPSSERSGHTHHPYVQYDGSTTSAHVNRGAYHSVHPSQLPTFNSSLSQPSTTLSINSQYGISPLPSMPYTRTPNTHSTSQAPLNTQTTATPSTDYADAATAAIHGLSSPLDPFSEHYEHLLQSTRQTLPVQSTLSQHPMLPSAQGPAELPGSVSNYGPQAARRSVHATRANQRSSENAPVRPPAQSGGPSRNSQVQIHRAAFERLHYALQGSNIEATEPPQQGSSRRSLPQPVVPHDTSNQPQMQAMLQPATIRAQLRHRAPHISSSPPPFVEQLRTSQVETSTRGNIPGVSPGVPTRIPPRGGSRTRGGNAAVQSQRGARRVVTAAVPPYIHLRPSRNLPSTSLALDHASAATILRSPLTRATASTRVPRRVPPQQRDQENSGVGEEQLMRQEETAINARYGEDIQRDTMDETPPRVGRVERRMFS
jgi:hypothetical protein